MPKFGSHIIFAEEAFRRRADLFPGLNKNDKRQMNALRFGAVGPDVTLFMFDPAFKDPNWRKGFDKCLEILKGIREIKEKLTLIADKLTEPVDDIADWLTGGLSKDLSTTANLCIENMIGAAKLGMATTLGNINLKNPIFDLLQNPNLAVDFITNPDWRNPSILIQATDNVGFPFRMFGHPFTDDQPWKAPTKPGDYSEWWWMDLLHYRKTATFGYQLLKSADTPLTNAYARGYMTHVAGDITGHPFINALVGGPFRSHAYRHLVVETLADTWLWDKQGRGDILDARLDNEIHLETADEKEIANLVTRAMREVYRPPFVPSLLSPDGYPSVTDFSSGYKALREYLYFATNGSVKRPLPPPNTPKEVIDEIRDLLKKNTPGQPPKWDGDLEDFLVALFSWFGKGLALIVMLATLPHAVLVRFLNLPARWLVYLVNLALFYVHSALRTMLCLVGWGYAGKEDFESFSFLENLVTAKAYVGDEVLFPYKSVPSPKLPYYWLVPPSDYLNLELERTEIEQRLSKPHAAFKSVMPDWMIDPSNKLSEPIVNRLIQASTVEDTLLAGADLPNNKYGLGNAVDFSISLLEGYAMNAHLDFSEARATFCVAHPDESEPRHVSVIPDFDLDGDRGYGFKTWDELPPNEIY